MGSLDESFSHAAAAVTGGGTNPQGGGGGGGSGLSALAGVIGSSFSNIQKSVTGNNDPNASMEGSFIKGPRRKARR